MPLDPQIQAILASGSSAAAGVESMTPEDARAGMLRSSRSLPIPEHSIAVEDRHIPAAADGRQIPIRTYRPAGIPQPALCVFFHGGGWVMGDLDTHDGLCRELAHETASVVVAVDYRLAPEHPFPAAAEDAYAATCWAGANADELGADGSRLWTAGDSAGGNLATVTCLKTRNLGGPAIGFQLLLCPITDCDFETPSYRENATGYGLTRAAMQWFFQNYAPTPEQAEHPHASPLRAESLAELPPAYVVTAEFDPLRDEGEAYARRLETEGVPTTLERWKGMYHSFPRRTHMIDRARPLWSRVREELHARLPPTTPTT